MDMFGIMDDRPWRRAIEARRARLGTLRTHSQNRLADIQVQTVSACQQFAEANACARELLDRVATSDRAYRAARASEE